MPGGDKQDLRGASEASESLYADHNLRYRAAIQFSGLVRGHKLLGLPEKHKKLCALLQGMDQESDL